jgi:hypothetical protein
MALYLAKSAVEAQWVVASIDLLQKYHAIAICEAKYSS